MGNEKHRPNTPDAPSYSVTAQDRGAQGASVLLLEHPPDGGPVKPKRDFHNGHPASEPDAPAHTITCEGGHAHSHGSVLKVEGKGGYHVPQDPDRPSATITAPVPGPRSRKSLTWPWDRPATSVTTRDALAPPGHHGHSEQFGPNCIVLSEKAAAILQGFPEDWVFSGRTKKARWSQIGQAMPPALAHAVAGGIVQWFETRSV